MNIETLRTSLDEVDLEINKLLAQRFFLCTCIAIEKKENNLPIIDGVSKGKRKELYTRILGEYGDAIYETIHEQSIKIQNKIK
jgi:chorismate mutase